jgi:flagellar hook-length control protein FliK
MKGGEKMDVQMTTVPATQTGTTNSTAAAKGTSKGNATSGNFSALLSDQTAQENAPVVDGQQSESELSMSMMLQMLQSLVIPIQTSVDQEASGTSDDSTLPELLLEAMNSNPVLADKLLQDPKVKKWFENAEDLLAALGKTPSATGVGFFTTWQQPTSESLSLKAQNTLLTLTALSKQQPDNPILNYLNSELTNTIQPLLSEILEGLGNAPKLVPSKVTTNAEESNEVVIGAENQKTTIGRITPHKYINKRETEQSVDSNHSVNLQTLQPKQEKFANKHIPVTVIEQTSSVTEAPTRPLVDLPIEANTTTNTIVTVGDLQKAQQVTIAAEKTPAPVLTAANFTVEMTTHVLKNMKITMSEGFSEAKLSLFPKNLGHVDVKISMHDGQLFAQFAADSLAGKQMLESQLPQLRQALLTQGLQVEKLEVTQSQNMSSSMFQEQRQPQTFNQSQRQPKNRSNEIEMDALDFKEDMDQMAQIRNNANGNSFDVTA